MRDLIVFFSLFSLAVEIRCATVENSIVGEPEIECHSDNVLVNFNTQRPFEGHVYVKGFYNQAGCRTDATNSRAATISVPFAACGVRRQRSVGFSPLMIYICVYVLIENVLVDFNTQRPFEGHVYVKGFYNQAGCRTDATNSRAATISVPFAACGVRRQRSVGFSPLMIYICVYVLIENVLVDFNTQRPFEGHVYVKGFYNQAGCRTDATNSRAATISVPFAACGVRRQRSVGFSPLMIYICVYVLIENVLVDFNTQRPFEGHVYVKGFYNQAGCRTDATNSRAATISVPFAACGVRRQRSVGFSPLMIYICVYVLIENVLVDFNTQRPFEGHVYVKGFYNQAGCRTDATNSRAATISVPFAACGVRRQRSVGFSPLMIYICVYVLIENVLVDFNTQRPFEGHVYVKGFYNQAGCRTDATNSRAATIPVPFAACGVRRQRSVGFSPLMIYICVYVLIENVLVDFNTQRPFEGHVYVKGFYNQAGCRTDATNSRAATISVPFAACGVRRQRSVGFSPLMIYICVYVLIENVLVDFNTQRPFEGHVYVKGFYNQAGCRTDATNSRAATISVPFAACGVRRQRSVGFSPLMIYICVYVLIENVLVDFNTQRPFEGHVYVKGFYNQAGCRTDATNSRAATISVPFAACGVRRQRSVGFSPLMIYICVYVLIENVLVDFNTQRPFEGHVYVKGFYNQAGCRTDATNSRAATISVPFAACGVRRQRSVGFSPLMIYICVYVLIENVLVDFNTQRPFEGHVYVKGFYNQAGCRTDATNSRAATISVPFAACGVRRQRSLNPNGLFVIATVVVSFHPQFLTMVDRAYHVKCFYMETDKTVTTDLGVSMITTQRTLTQSIPMPTCRYQVLAQDKTGAPLKFAQIGEQVYHQWSCDTETIDIFCMTVHSCFVDNGQGTQVQLLDENGCAQDKFLLENVEYETDLKGGRGTMVFKFADKPTLFFNCQIRLTLKAEGACERTSDNCELPRRGRRAVDMAQMNDTEASKGDSVDVYSEEITVFGDINMPDPGNEQIFNKEVPVEPLYRRNLVNRSPRPDHQDMCVSRPVLYALVIGLSLAIVVPTAAIAVLCMRDRRKDEIKH